MCPECGSTNITDHMVWDGTGFAGGNRRCENCNAIFGPESQPVPATRGRGRPKKEEIEAAAEESQEGGE